MKRASVAILFGLSTIVALSCSSAGSSGTTGGCGDGKKGVGENCDGVDLGGLDCQKSGFKSGKLACSKTCTLDTSGCCVDQCVNVGDTTCQSQKLMTCAEAAAGCRTWTQTSDCAATGKVCEASGGKALCKSKTCTDACTLQGATECNGSAVEVCKPGTDGCLTWLSQTDCAATGQACSVSGGVASCGGSCTDTCKAGETQCNVAVIQECKTNGSCLGWVIQTDCSQTGQICDASSGTPTCAGSCNNKCLQAGLQTCMSNAVNTCKADTSGCLNWAQTQDCNTGNLICKLGGAGTAKCEGVCLNPCPTLGEKVCNANSIQSCVTTTTGCQEWKVDSTCPIGQACDGSSGTFKCVTATPTGEDCGHVMPVKAGKNTISWTATTNNYLTTTPSCSYSDVDGPDVVLVYQPTFTGAVDYTFEKPSSTRWVAVVASGNCGTLGSALSCSSEYSDPSMGDSFNVTSGSTYFFYVADTQSGSLPLSNPLILNLTEIDCSSFSAGTIAQNPANGATTTSLSPKLQVTFETSIDPNAGSVTLTGNKGTSLTYSIATARAISLSTDGKTMTIDPGKALPAGEVITVTWSGITDSKCKKAVKPANWSFTVITPPCSPGAGGMVGTTMTPYTTGISSISAYYVQVDETAGGYAFIGGSSELFRLPKTGGGTLQSITTLAGIGSSQLGYDMVIAGNDIFTIESKTTGLTGQVWRISKDGGQSWMSEDFAVFPTQPVDSFDSASFYKGKLYLLTNSSSSTATEVWSVDTALAPPVTAKLEKSFTGESYCTGIGADDQNFYVACGGNDHVVRVSRTTSTQTLLADSYTISTVQNALQVKDANNDGLADFVYFHTSDDVIYFVCNAATATPYTDTLVTFGTGYGNYGMGFDKVANQLYVYDDSSSSLIAIH